MLHRTLYQCVLDMAQGPLLVVLRGPYRMPGVESLSTSVQDCPLYYDHSSPHLVVFRAYYSWLCIQVTPSRAQRTLWDTGDQTRFSHIQGEYPPLCPMAPAPTFLQNSGTFLMHEFQPPIGMYPHSAPCPFVPLSCTDRRRTESYFYYRRGPVHRCHLVGLHGVPGG